MTGPDSARKKIPQFTAGDRIVLVILCGLAITVLSLQYAAASGWGKARPQFTSTPVQPHLININTAPEWELQALLGVGPKRARQIVEYREKHGPFASVEDLRNVSGFGGSTLDHLRAYLTIDQPEGPNVSEK